MKHRYREIRLENKMTLEQSAKFLGRSKQWLSEVERGNIALNYEDSIMLAKAYGATPDIFLPIESNNISQISERRSSIPRRKESVPVKVERRVKGRRIAAQ